MPPKYKGSNKCVPMPHGPGTSCYSHGSSFAEWRFMGKVPSDIPCPIDRLHHLCDCPGPCRGHPCFCWVEPVSSQGSVEKTKVLLMYEQLACVHGTKCSQGVGHHYNCCALSCCQYLTQPPNHIGPFRPYNSDLQLSIARYLFAVEENKMESRSVTKVLEKNKQSSDAGCYSVDKDKLESFNVCVETIKRSDGGVEYVEPNLNEDIKTECH